MTDDEAKELGLRAMAAGFRWVPGVLAGGWPMSVRLSDDRHPDPALDEYDWPHDLGLRFPDFRDPSGATLGVLLAQVREAWEVGSLVYRPWTLWAYFDTEAEALVAALEAAP